MREKTISIIERNLMFVIAGQLFDQAPNRQPRKAETIMQKAKDTFRADAYNWTVPEMHGLDCSGFPSGIK